MSIVECFEALSDDNGRVHGYPRTVWHPDVTSERTVCQYEATDWRTAHGQQRRVRPLVGV
jgi:hypothetical protein